MRRSISACLAALALSIWLPAALAQPAMVADTAKGKALVDGKGMTLYVYDRDGADTSNCNGRCAELWVPFAAAAEAKASGGWSVVTRSDGRKQWAYKGKPLYTWVKDKKAGDTSGDGVNNVWHIAVP